MREREREKRGKHRKRETIGNKSSEEKSWDKGENCQIEEEGKSTGGREIENVRRKLIIVGGSVVE